MTKIAGMAQVIVCIMVHYILLIANKNDHVAKRGLRFSNTNVEMAILLPG